MMSQRLAPGRRALASVLAVMILSASAGAPRAHAGFLFPILGAPFRAIARIRENSPFAFPILGAPFRALAGGPVFASQVDGSGGLPAPVSGGLPR